MRFWIKLHLDILDDTRFGLLPDFQKWRTIELFLVAGENGNDGLLPPVERLAWRIRLPREKLEETLSVLSQIGVVHETPEGWVVTDFKKNQEALTSTERSRNFRRGNDHATKRCEDCNEGAATDSTSTSSSDSKEEGVQREGEELALPRSPGEAMLHPDLQVYETVAGGRIPGESQYRPVIDAVRFLRTHRKLDDAALKDYLAPYWLAWSSRKRKDGRPYDPSNLTWLTEWALNGSIPVQGGSVAPGGSAELAYSRVPSPEETRRTLDERDEMIKHAVPPPEEVLEKMRSVLGRMKGRDNHGIEKMDQAGSPAGAARAPDRDPGPPA